MKNLISPILILPMDESNATRYNQQHTQNLNNKIKQFHFNNENSKKCRKGGENDAAS